MGLRTPPVDEGGEEGTIHVWEASMIALSKPRKLAPALERYWV